MIEIHRSEYQLTVQDMTVDELIEALQEFCGGGRIVRAFAGGNTSTTVTLMLWSGTDDDDRPCLVIDGEP